MGFGPDDSTSVLRVYESMLGPQGQAVAPTGRYRLQEGRIGIEAEAGTGRDVELGLPAREPAVAIHVHVRQRPR